MSSYFDDLEGKVRVLAHATNATTTDDSFLEALATLEDEVAAVVTAVIVDREFPVDLRHKIADIIRTRRVGDLNNEEARAWALNLRCSNLFSDLHSAFHAVASRRLGTRFGLLFDDPAAILRRRDAWERDANSVHYRVNDTDEAVCGVDIASAANPRGFDWTAYEDQITCAECIRVIRDVRQKSSRR